MFSTEHFIWMGISFAVIAVSIYMLNKYKPALSDVLTVCCVLGVISELTVLFCFIEIVPSADGSQYFLYYPLDRMPFHLCSIQLIFIFAARFMKNEEFRENLLAFMYPTCVAGAGLALILTTSFDGVPLSQAFTHPKEYQYYLYHAMLICLGAYIAMSGEVKFKKKHFLTTFCSVALLGWISVYINSLCAMPIYDAGKLKSVEFATNYFFTFKTPVGIVLTEKWQWFVYILILLAAVVVLEIIFYTPMLLREKKKVNKKTALVSK